MTWLAKDQIHEANASRYTTSDDFCRVFSEELYGLYQLSFLLTGDHEKAERCFFAGLEDCCRANHVFRDWALSWAKCTISRHAIRELRPRPSRDITTWSETVLSASAAHADFQDGYFKAEAVLALEDFERFVFVLSVLERHSDRDCALLLGCSILEVRRARIVATLHIVGSSSARLAVVMVCPLDRGSHSSPELKGPSAGGNALGSAGASTSVSASSAT